MKNILNKVLFLVLIASFALLALPKQNTIASPLLPNDENYLIAVDKMASPAGGLESIVKKVVYPRSAQTAKIQGTVYALVYINEEGGVDDVKVVKGIGAGCDEAAIDAIKKTKFSPAISGGAPVKSKLSLPIIFKL